jgi:hypothetical protein
MLSFETRPERLREILEFRKTSSKLPAAGSKTLKCGMEFEEVLCGLVRVLLAGKLDAGIRQILQRPVSSVRGVRALIWRKLRCKTNRLEYRKTTRNPHKRPLFPRNNSTRRPFRPRAQIHITSPWRIRPYLLHFLDCNHRKSHTICLLKSNSCSNPSKRRPKKNFYHGMNSRDPYPYLLSQPSDRRAERFYIIPSYEGKQPSTVVL